MIKKIRGKRKFRDITPSATSALAADTHWQKADDARVVLGGIFFDRVRYPLVVDGENYVRLERNSLTKRLAASFRILDTNGNQVALVARNRITQFDPAMYAASSGTDRSLLVEIATRRIICDIGIPAHDDGYELDIAFLTHLRADYPLQAHPNRLKIGPPRSSPNFSGGTFTGELGSATAAMTVQNTSLYMLGARIENLAIGIQVISNDNDKGVNVGTMFWLGN